MFRCSHAPAIARGLRSRAQNLPHTRTRPFSTSAPRVGGVLCQGTRTAALDLGKPEVGHQRLFGHSALESAPQQPTSAREKDHVVPSNLASRQRDQSERAEQEGAKKQKTETRTRDSPAHSLRSGRRRSLYQDIAPLKANARAGKLLTTPSRSLKLLIPLPTGPSKGMFRPSLFLGPRGFLTFF